jgi:hypothetical protein
MPLIDNARTETKDQAPPAQRHRRQRAPNHEGRRVPDAADPVTYLPRTDPMGRSPSPTQQVILLSVFLRDRGAIRTPNGRAVSRHG